jgi:phage terminase small subunit
MADLTPFEKAFKNRYLKDFNATQSYLDVKPHVQYQTAKSEANKLLTRPHLQEAISKELDKGRVKTLHTKEYLTLEAHEIKNLAQSEKKYQTALNAVDLKAKINGIYREQETDLTSYTAIMHKRA